MLFSDCHRVCCFRWRKYENDENSTSAFKLRCLSLCAVPCCENSIAIILLRPIHPSSSADSVQQFVQTAIARRAGGAGRAPADSDCAQQRRRRLGYDGSIRVTSSDRWPPLEGDVTSGALLLPTLRYRDTYSSASGFSAGGSLSLWR